MKLLVHALPWIQIIISISLAGLILLQRSGAEVGGALGAGGDGGGGTSYTRRGFERVMFVTTIILGFAFILVNFVALLIK